MTDSWFIRPLIEENETRERLESSINKEKKRYEDKIWHAREAKGDWYVVYNGIKRRHWNMRRIRKFNKKGKEEIWKQDITHKTRKTGQIMWFIRTLNEETEK